MDTPPLMNIAVALGALVLVALPCVVLAKRGRRKDR